MKRILSIILLLAALQWGCEEFDPGGIPGNRLSGDWYVTTSLDGAALSKHDLISTYTTAKADGSEIFVDDLDHLFGLKVKTPVLDLGSLTFGGMDLISLQGDTVSIKNGQVFPGGGRSKTGAQTDSIYLEVQYFGDPDVYVLTGHQRTGHAEDDF